jgi:hypothetical protein
LSDEQILARLGGRSPGVRPLRRAFSLGQARAERVHRMANKTTSTSEEDTSPTEDQMKKSDQESTQMMITDMYEASLPEGSTEITDQATTNDRAKANDKTHPCITDRVGESRKPQDPAETGRERPGRAAQGGAEALSRQGVGA